MKTILRHLSSFIAPLTMSILLPYLILRYEKGPALDRWLAPMGWQVLLGALITLAGAVAVILTIRLFIQIGNGTIMPWDPTRKLIVAGPYQYVRNPMIAGLLVLQTGEAVLFASLGLALLAAAFFIINTVYFIFSEEPGLEKRFGAEYVAYKKHVPRWLPRVTPWGPK